VIGVMITPSSRPPAFQAAMSRACIGRISDRSLDATFQPTMLRE
jgi:hypothetical protein